MEQGESLFEKIHAIDEKTRVEVYGSLKANIIDILRDKGFAMELFALGGEDNSKVLVRDVESRHTRYRFIRNLGKDFAEIQIQRNTKRYDNPNIALEEVRFKIGRPGTSFAPPDLEYHRTLRNGGSRTLTNNVLALKRIAKFIGEMNTNLR